MTRLLLNWRAGHVGDKSQIAQGVGCLEDFSPKVTRHLGCYHHGPALVLQRFVESLSHSVALKGVGRGCLLDGAFSGQMTLESERGKLATIFRSEEKNFGSRLILCHWQPV